METDQNFDVKRDDFIWFRDKLAVDGVDIAIWKDLTDPHGNNAIVDLIFVQHKGYGKREVCAALNLTIHQLERLQKQIESKITAYRNEESLNDIKEKAEDDNANAR